MLKKIINYILKPTTITFIFIFMIFFAIAYTNVNVKTYLTPEERKTYDYSKSSLISKKRKYEKSIEVLETSIKRSYELTDRTKYYETLYMLKDTILTIIRLKKYDYDYERKNYLVELENVDYKIYSLLKNELTEVQDDMQYYNNYEMNFNIALFTLDNLYTEDLFFKYSTVDLLPIIMQLKKTSTESSQRIINLYLNKIERDRKNQAYPELLLKSIETLVRW